MAQACRFCFLACRSSNKSILHATRGPAQHVSKYQHQLIQKQIRLCSKAAAVQEDDGNTNLVTLPPSLFRERFIPLTRKSCVALLMQGDFNLNPQQLRGFENFSLSLDAAITSRFNATKQELKTLFDPINPDKDTLMTRQFSHQERSDNEFWLLHRLGQVMEKANFYEIPYAEVEEKVKRVNKAGIQVSVSVDQYDIMRYWVLGKESVVPKIRYAHQLYNWITRQPADGIRTYYKRVIVASRVHGSDKLSLKAFKEVPADDLEKLLPQGSIMMTSFDMKVIGITMGAAAFGLLAKYVTYLAKLKVSWTLGFSGIMALLAVRTWFMYNRRHTSYLSSLNQMLYYKNIANNRGLIALVVDRAEDEQFKEALLTYTFVSSMQEQMGGISQIKLENAVEDWIHGHTGSSIEFSAADSINTLEKIGILSRGGTGLTTTFSVLPIDAANSLLPATPMSILTRPDEGDVFEGYDSMAPAEKEDENRYKMSDRLHSMIGWVQSRTNKKR